MAAGHLTGAEMSVTLPSDKMSGQSRECGMGLAPDPTPAAMETLRDRPDFLRAARALRQGTPGFMLQARKRGTDETGAKMIRIGYTCSKKIGNAVLRNRAKRRLRALARDIVPFFGQAGWDYVLVGRPGTTITRPFGDMRTDLERAFRRIHRSPDQS